MKFNIILIILFSGTIWAAPIFRHPRQAPTTTTPEPIDESSDEQEDEQDDQQQDPEILDRALMVAELLPDPLSIDRTKKVLQTALDLLNRRKASSRSQQCQRSGVVNEAKNVLRVLTGDPTIGSTSEESQQSLNDGAADEYCEDPVIIPGSQRRISLDTMKNIVKMSENKCSERTIKAKYRWYDRKYLERFKNTINGESTSLARRDQIETFVRNRVLDARNRHLPVHEYHLRRWALEQAERVGAANFKASSFWVHSFKKRNNIVSRKITDLGNRAMNSQLEEIEASRARFLNDFSNIRHLYRPHLIWNTDQSGFRYEISNERTLSIRGERDTILDVDSQNKNTHSYTIQPIISRDGRLVGKLLLCMKETGDSFGPRVEREVRDLERELGNVHVVCSKSGKMSRALIDHWSSNVLIPAMRDAMLPSDGETIIGSQGSNSDPAPGPSWASEPESSLTPDQLAIRQIRNQSPTYVPRPDLLLLADSWGGHSSRDMSHSLGRERVALLQIPKHTTDILQPLDVNFFRQYKKFVKKITEEALYQAMIQQITSRSGIINMHGVIFNQLSSPRYYDMIRYAWRNTDPHYGTDGIDPRSTNDFQMVESIQFAGLTQRQCEVENCHATSFIRCSHCGKHLCLSHFLERVCFHHVEESEDVFYDSQDDLTCSGASQSSQTTTERPSAGGAAGAIVGGSITGAAIGLGGSIVSSSAVAGAGAVGAGAGAAATGSAVASHYPKQSRPDEEIPLLDITKILPPRPEYVETVLANVDYKDLIRSSN